MKRSRMHALVRATLDRPVTVLMLLCSTVLVGVIARSNIELNLFPSGFVVSNVSIRIPVPNANPVEVEEQVTRPTEEVLRQIAGLEEINTSSSKDRSVIRISFAKDRDPNEAFAEVRDLMEVAKLSWPEDVQDYFTNRFNVDTDLPVISFGIMLDKWESDTSFIIDEKITKEIEAVDGVARVNAWGIVEESVRIFVDKERAAALGVNIYEVAQAISADNQDVIGGKIEEGGQHFYLRSLGRFKSLQEIERYPIRPNVQLKEVAEVTTAKSYRNFVFRLNGQRSVWFWVNKESNANTVDVCRRIRSKLDGKIANDPRLLEKGWTWFRPDTRDFGKVIEGALGDLVRNALLGGLLAIIPLFLFLRRLRMTLIITMAIPASLLITIGCLYFSGGSLNVLSMLGITIAIGMLVDNSIVVVENIVRHRQRGDGAAKAALDGTAEVALAVTLATLTTVVAFVPLIFMNADATAAFFSKAIGLPVCYAVLASLLVALLFIPLGTVMLYRKSDGSNLDHGWLDRAAARLGVARRPDAALHESAGRMPLAAAALAIPLIPIWLLTIGVTRLIDAVERAHQRALGWSLGNRFIALALIFVLTMSVNQIAFSTVNFNAFDDESGGSLRMNVELDSNYTLDDANVVFTNLFSELEKRWDELGVDFTFYWFDRSGGTLFIGLKEQDPEHSKAVVQTLKDELPKTPGARVSIGVERQNEDKSSLTLNIFGPDVDELARIGDDVRDRIESIPGVAMVTGGVDRENDEVVVEPDRERMQVFGVDPRVLMGTVQYGIRGQRLPDFHIGDQKMQMFIEFDDSDTTTVRDLKHMNVWSREGSMQPLSNFADVYYRRGYGTIRKTNGRSSVGLTVEPLVGEKEAVAKELTKRLSAYPLPKGYSWSETSDEDLMAEMMEIMGTAALALVLVLLLMGVLFESVMLPWAVFTTIPFAIFGGIWGLAFTGTQVDLVGMIGLIVLVGIVVNNGIVLLDCAHRLIQDGVERRRALLEAARMRLRPILMTTATTIVGLIPMALAEASGSIISYKSLARGVIGGLAVSTLATLTVVPLCYTLLADLRGLMFEAGRALRDGRVESAAD